MSTPRPLTPEESAMWRKMGYDPSKITAVDPEVAPPAQQVQAQGPSSLRTGAEHAAASAAPMVAGGLAAARILPLIGAGLEAIGAAGAAPTGGAAALLIPLGAAIVASSVTSYAQDKLMPDSWKAELAAGEQAHPLAAKVGQIAAMPLGGFNPSKDVLRAGQYGISKLIGAPVTTEGAQSAANAMMGASVGLAPTAAAQLIRGEFNPGQLVESAALGSVFTRPNALGQMYGFHATQPRAVDVGGKEFELGARQVVSKDKDTAATEQKAEVAQKAQQAVQTLKQTIAQPELNFTGQEQFQPEFKFQGQREDVTPESIRTPEVQKLSEKIEKRRGSGLVNERIVNAWNEVLQEHGLSLKLGELPAPGPGMKGAKGMYEGNTVSIDPEKASVTTMPHEISHHIWKSMTPQIRAHLEAQAEPIIKQKNAEREAWNKAHPEDQVQMLTTEEFYASEMGAKAAQRAAAGENVGLRNWWEDTKAYLKTKYGSPEMGDIYRTELVRLMNGNPSVVHQFSGIVKYEGEQGDVPTAKKVYPSQTPEAKRARAVANRARNAAEHEATLQEYAKQQEKRGEVPAERVQGRSPNTWIDSRIKMPRIEDQVEADKQYDYISAVANKTINKLVGPGKMSEADRQDVVQMVAAELSQTGIDRRGTGGKDVERILAAEPDFYRSITRRTREVMKPLMEEYRQKVERGEISLDQEVGEEGEATVGDIFDEEKIVTAPQAPAGKKYVEPKAPKAAKKVKQPEPEPEEIGPSNAEMIERYGAMREGLIETEGAEEDSKQIRAIDAIIEHLRKQPMEATFNQELAQKSVKFQDEKGDIPLNRPANTEAEYWKVMKEAEKKDKTKAAFQKMHDAAEKAPEPQKFQDEAGDIKNLSYKELEVLRENAGSKNLRAVSVFYEDALRNHLMHKEDSVALKDYLSKPNQQKIYWVAYDKNNQPINVNGRDKSEIELFQAPWRENSAFDVASNLGISRIEPVILAPKKGIVEDSGTQGFYGGEPNKNYNLSHDIRIQNVDQNKIQQLYPDAEEAGGPALTFAKQDAIIPVKNLSQKFQDEAGDIFTTKAKQIITNPPHGMASAQGTFEGKKLANYLRNKLTPAEWDMLQKAGIEEAFGTKIFTKEYAQKWLEENGPKVKVESYGMEPPPSEAKSEYDKMTHEWADNLDEDSRLILMYNMDYVDGRRGNVHGYELEKLKPEDYKKAVKYFELRSQSKADAIGIPKATSHYESVSAFDTHEPMPEWTKSKENRNVQRVDVVLPFVEKTEGVSLTGDKWIQEHNPLWTQDNLHENLPNTLGWAMIQYKTGPNGEKIAFIAEAQSRWGQEMRDAKNAYEVRTDNGGHTYHVYDVKDKKPISVDTNKSEAEAMMRGMIKEDLRNANVSDHPLLRDYNRLILKAAIEQARKEGATHIMVSDAETAMMSEGHDKVASRGNAYPAPESGVTKVKVGDYGLRYANGQMEVYASKDAAEQRLSEYLARRNGNPAGLKLDTVKENDLKTIVKQEGGMRLNYDEGKMLVSEGNIVARKDPEAIRLQQYLGVKEHGMNTEAYPTETKGQLPSIMEELTGSEGKRVSLGEHKNALADKNILEYGFETESDALARIETLKQQYPELEFNHKYHRSENDWSVASTKNPTRSNLIFKNPDGTPKTDVSGTMYPLEGVSKRLESGEKFSLFNKFQGASEDVQTNTPEFKKWFGDSKVVDESGKPLVVYHGTQHGGYNVFNTDNGGAHFGTIEQANNHLDILAKSREKWKEPVFFDDTTTPWNGTAPNRGENDAIYPVYLKITKPFYVPDKHNPAGWNKTIEAAKELGYDGLAYQNEYEGKGLSYVVWNPEQIKSATGNKGTFDPKNPDIRFQGSQDDVPTRQGFLKPFEATFDRLEKIDPKLAGAFRKWEGQKDIYEGWGNLAAKDLQRFKRDDVNRVFEAHREAFRNKTELPAFDDTEQKISDILTNYFHDSIGQERKDLGVKIDERDPSMNKSYVPDMLSPEAVDLLVNKPYTPEGKATAQEWADYIYQESGGKVSLDDAKKYVEQYTRAMGSESGNYLSVEYGAIRKAEGYGIPENLREKDAVSALLRYSRRAAKDLAMFKHLESDPEIAATLELSDRVTGATRKHPGVEGLSKMQEVKDAMKWVTGEFASAKTALGSPRSTAAVRLLHNLIMGTGTGLRDTASVPVNMIPYINKFSDLGAALRGVAKFRENARESIRMGATKPNIDKTVFSDIATSPDRTTEFLRKAASFARIISGREAIENFNRDVTYSIGKELAQANIIGARNGDKTSQQFVKKFGELVEGDVTEMEGAELEDAIQKMAKSFVDRNQGTYGGRGLPTGMIDSQFAPFWSLQKWSLEKSNTIYQDVVQPFLTGENRKPMLTYLLGSIATGAAIEELNKALSGKKSQDPEIAEVLAKGRPEDYVAKFVSLMQLGSYAGIMSDITKAATDAAVYGKTPRNLASFPTATALMDTQEKLSFVAEALKQGEDPFEVVGRFALDMMTQNVQTARLIANHTLKQEDIERSGKYRDMRVFSQLSGDKAQRFPAVNPYLDLDMKKFKRTDDLGEAVEQIPGIISGALEKSKGDFFDFERRLRGAKSMSYKTMPSLEEDPLKFVQYYKYVVDSQGQEQADALLADYMKQNMMNKIKSSLIP